MAEGSEMNGGHLGHEKMKCAMKTRRNGGGGQSN
jgi:hypothetical protein